MRNGFTLIELLAVIVILAIIALIATPIVLNIIEDTKESSQLRSAEFYLDAVETAVAKQMMEDTTFKPSSCDIQTNGNLKCDEKEVKVEINGEKPTSGPITIENGKIKDPQIVLNGKTMVKDNDKWFYSGLYDENDNLIVTWDQLVNSYGIDIQKNYSEGFNSSKPGEIIMSNEKLSKGVKLVIDSSVTKVGNYAFHNCTNIKEIILPNSVISIGSASIRNCTSLEKIIIPSSVISIGAYVFAGCNSLKEITIPNSVITIEGNAFRNCTSLEKITIPNSVTSMGKYAFQNCTNLKEIIIPDSVTSLGAGLFSKCTNLSKVVIGKGVTSIGTNAFEANKSLTEIVIPRNVINIDDYAFNQCWNLKTINYTGTQEEWNFITFGDNWDDNNTPTDKIINYNYVIN